MLIKFHNCPDEKFNSIIEFSKKIEFEIFTKRQELCFVSYLISRKIIISHDLNFTSFFYSLLIENEFFNTTCSIIYVTENYSGGYGETLVNNIEDPVIITNVYHYIFLNFDKKLFLYSSYNFSNDLWTSTYNIYNEFNLKLLCWNTLFSINDLSSLGDSLLFFETTNKPKAINLNSDKSWLDEELWNYGAANKHKIIFESFFSGSIIDFLIKIEFSVIPNTFNSEIINKTRLLSSPIYTYKNSSLDIREITFESWIIQNSEKIYIKTDKEFQTIESWIINDSYFKKISRSNFIYSENFRSPETLLNLINQPLYTLDYINNYDDRLLFIDCETTSIFTNNYPPRLVSLSWAVTTLEGKLLEANDFLIQPDGFEIDKASSEVHGIENDFAKENGISINEVKQIFATNFSFPQIVAIVGHNLQFDLDVLKNENFDLEIFDVSKFICTMKSASKGISLFGNKWPKLNELFVTLFHREPIKSHNSLQDVHSTMLVYFKMVELGYLPKKIRER